MRRLRPFLFALFTVTTIFAEPAEKPLGRTLNQRFGKFDQGLVFDIRQGATGDGRTFQAGSAQMKSFYIDRQFASGQYATRDFGQARDAKLGNSTFSTDQANIRGKYEIPNVERQPESKAAPGGGKSARESGKSAAVRDLPDGNRPYLGPESKKLDRAVDPNKPLPGWAGDRLEPLTLEQVRQLLNKNK